MYRRNILSSRLSAGDEEDIGKSGKSREKTSDIYSNSGKNLGDTSGSAVHTITLKPVSVKTVLLIPTVQGCSAPGANIRDRVKNRAASVKAVNFSGNSSLKGSTSVCRMKNRSSPKKSLIFL